MSESTHQAKLIKNLEKEGFFVIKLMRTNVNGIPDLLALKSGETPLFIEAKGERTPVKKLQEYRIKELQSHGFKAIIHREGHDDPKVFV